MRVQEGALLLRVCGACLSEVSSLRREVREALDKFAPRDGAETPTPPPLQVVGDRELRKGEELRSACLVEDADLRKLLVSAFESGQLLVSLKELTEKASEGADGIVQAVQEELQRGSLRALSLVSGEVQSETDSVVALLTHYREAGDAGAQCPAIVVWPQFRRSSSALAEVLIERCREERLLPPLELVLEALRSLVSTPDAEVPEAEILFAVNDAIGQSGLRSPLQLTTSGRIVLPRDGQVEPYPLFSEEEASVVDGGAPALVEASQAMVPWLDVVRKVCQACASRQGPTLELRDAPGALLGLLGALRSLSGLPEVGELPEVLTRPGAGGAVLWAFDRAAAGGPSPPVRPQLPAAEPQPPCAQPSQEVQMLPPQHLQEQQTLQLQQQQQQQLWQQQQQQLLMQQQQQQHHLQQHQAPAPMMAVSHLAFEAEAAKQALGQSVRVMTPAVARPEMVESPPAENADTSEGVGTPWCSELDNRGDVQGSDSQDLKSETQVLFVECFKDDLLQNRHLLMSQINNLYKMRNGGNTLQYKLAGYDKLHDFLLDIPGLEPQGTGNKMEIKIVDMPQFEAFCAEITEGRELPRFERPQPVPESFQSRVIEVFRRAGSREIPAKNFRDLWNCVFPTEKLHCKDFGYRDVKGLLANVPMIEKVGSKSSTRYVLKEEVDLNEQSEGGGALPHGMAPVNIDVSDGNAGQPFKVAMNDPPRPQQQVSNHPVHVGMMDRWHAGPQQPGWGPLAQHGPAGGPVPQQQHPQQQQQSQALPSMQGQPQFGQLCTHQEDAEAAASAPGAWGQLAPSPLNTTNMPQPRMRQAAQPSGGMGLPAPCSLVEGPPQVASLGASLEAAGSPAQNFVYGGEVPQQNPSYLRVPGPQQQRQQPPQQQQQQQQQHRQGMRPLSPHLFGLEAQGLQDLQQTQQLSELQANSGNINVPFNLSPILGVPPSSMQGDFQQRLGQGDNSPSRTLHRLGLPAGPSTLPRQQPVLPPQMYHTDGTLPASRGMQPVQQGGQELEPDRSPGAPWLPRPRDQPPPESAPSMHSMPLSAGSATAPGQEASPHSAGGQSPSLAAAEAFGNAFGNDPLSAGKQLSALAMAGSMPHPRGLSQLRGDCPRGGQASGDDAVASPGPPPGLVKTDRSNNVPPTVPESAPAEEGLPPAVPETVPETGPLAPEESGPDSALTAAEHRRLRRLQKKNPNNKQAASFFSSPGAISSEDRDASKCQGKFDMSRLYQAQLRTDRPCMMVDFSNGLILLSNTLCDSLFENLVPLQQRDVVDLIHEDDKVNFSACIMYLSIGKFMVMGPQTLRMLTAQGEQRVIVNGEQMVGSYWWLDVQPMDKDCDDSAAPPPVAAAAAAAAAAGIGGGPLGTSMGAGESTASLAAAAAAAAAAMEGASGQGGLGTGLASSSSLGSSGLGPWAPMPNPSAPPHWPSSLHWWNSGPAGSEGGTC